MIQIDNEMINDSLVSTNTIFGVERESAAFSVVESIPIFVEITTSSSDISKFPQLSSILNRFQIENRRKDSVSLSFDQMEMGASQNDPSDECKITLSEKESGNCSCYLSTV
jgi:hypothetical protein